MSLDLLFPNFETLIRTPEDVARLNEAILGLAVQGKLVPQDPNDGPASLELREIARERDILVETGKVRRSKLPIMVQKEDHPFQAPRGWTWCRLDSVPLYPLTDGDWVESKDQDPDGEVRLIQLADVGVDEFRDRSDRFLTLETAARLNCTYLAPGDVLIARLPAPIGRACIFPGVIQPSVTVVDVAIARLSDHTDRKYFVHALNSTLMRQQIVEYGKGATRFRVATGHLKQLIFPLPPLAEQRRIVAKVESLFAHTRALEAELRQAQADIVTVDRAALNRLSVVTDAGAFAAAWATVRDAFDLLYDDPRNVAELRQAILQLAVQGKLVPQDPADEPASELLKRIRAEKRRLVKEAKLREEKPLRTLESDQAATELPPGWAWARVGMLGKTQTGSTPSTGTAEFYGDDYPFVKPADISDKGISFRSEGLSRLGLETGRLIEANSVLMVCIGGSIGKVSYVDRDCSCNQQINALTPFGGMSARFLYYFLRSPYFQHEILSRAPQTTLPILSKGKWEAIALPLPPLAEQHRIVAKVDQLMQQCDALAAGLARAEGQRRALTAAALHGAFG